jgi:erythromycin esterase
MDLRYPLLVSLVTACLAADSAAAQTTLNLDFERRGDSPDVPDGWFVGGQGYEVVLDGADVRSGTAALRMTRQEGQGGFGVATATLPVKLARGKTVRLSGDIKAEGVQTGYAGLWLRVDGPGGATLGFDNMAVRIAEGKSVRDDRGVRGRTGWKRYSIEVAVDPAAVNINFGCLHSGDGTVRFDALSLEIDGMPYEALSRESLAPPLKPEQLAWLKAAALPFTSDRAGTGLDDLRPLKALIGDARIVALGEATHGTAEFFRMKHRLVEFLATEMGFTVFAIEASMPEAFHLNDYVLRGEGDPKELLRGMYFWTWNTQEVLDMILWMREFNASGKGRIEFLGFDMQEPRVAAGIVRAFVARADPEYAQALEGAYAGLDARARLRRKLGGEKDAAEAEAEKMAGRARDVLAHLEGAHDRLVQVVGGDAAAVEWAIQNARIVVQALTVATAPGGYRDRSMAENVDWILSQRPQGTKIVLWAHNGHVSRRTGSMGGFLAERHKEDMVVAGFAFHEGRYTAVARGVGLRANDAGPSGPGSIEYALHQVGEPRVILDLRKVDKASPASGWLADPVDHRNIGALAIASAFSPNNLPGNYDLLVFFDRTTASVLLPPHRQGE